MRTTVTLSPAVLPRGGPVTKKSKNARPAMPRRGPEAGFFV